MLDRIQKKIGENGLDGFLIQNADNINWICNKSSYYIPGMMLVLEKEVYFFTKSRNINAFIDAYKNIKFIFGGIERVVDICNEKNLKDIGVEGDYISFNSMKVLGALFMKQEIKPCSDFIEDLRMIKTPEEIGKLREVTQLSDRCYLEFLNHLKVGISEIEAKNIFREILFKNGAEDLSFDILLSSGKQAFLPHSTSTDKILKKGDLVLMDFGIVLDGYCSDTTRTVALGEADERQRELYKCVLDSQNHAINSIRAGQTLHEADSFAREIINKVEPNHCYDYGLGHGIGRAVHEKPRMAREAEGILLENTVVSVEPGIYIEGWGGIRIEDIIVVKKDERALNLTTAPKELIIL